MSKEIEIKIDELRKKRRRVEKEVQKYLEKRNRLNKESKYWSEIRDRYNAEVRALLSEAGTHKAKRDEINEMVKKAKDERSQYNRRVRELEDQLRELKHRLLPRDGVSLRRMKRELKILEFKQMTTVLSPEKERELVNHMARLSEQIREKEKILDENEEIRRLKAELMEMRERAEAAHKRVGQLADLAQVEHDKMIELYNQIDEKRRIADDAQEKFVHAKIAADEAHKNYISLLNQMKDYDKMIAGLRQKEKEIKRREEEEREKARLREIFEKLKAGEKLSTEDLMLLQKSG